MNKIIVTGCAGFIGMHVCKDLLRNFEVFGIDNINDYYDPDLKLSRLEQLSSSNNFHFEKVDIKNNDELDKIFKEFKPERVINLAAQAGVQYSLTNPTAYIDDNITGFLNILEGCRRSNVKNLIYASSSSVYGLSKKSIFSETDVVNKPISMYALSKTSNELMAHTYSHLYNLNTTGLRFFTVYGPWGRPDMAMYIFAKKIMNGESITVYNDGLMQRDFTYIDDIVKGVRSCIMKNYKYEIFNLGNNKKENLMDMIAIIQNRLKRDVKIKYEKIKLGDVISTYADTSYAASKLGYYPKTSIEEGIPKFLDWFLDFHNYS